MLLPRLLPDLQGKRECGMRRDSSGAMCIVGAAEAKKGNGLRAEKNRQR